MPVLIPVASAGERVVTVNLRACSARGAGPGPLRFRTYFVRGQTDHWLLDIADEAERPLAAGLNLVPGADNLLKGAGDALDGCQLFVVMDETLRLLWFAPGEDNPFKPGDPMDMIGKNLWV